MTATRDLSIVRERFENSVRLAASLLVLASSIALLLTQKLYGSSFVLMFATVAAWFLARKPVRSSFWEVASFCYLIFFFLDVFRFSSSLAPALVHLFVFIIINKLFNLYTDRDYYQLYLLTFLCILAASSLSVEIEMFYLIVTYILLLVWNIASITLFREWKRGQQSDPVPFSLFHPVFLFSIVLASAVTFAVAMAIFFVLPRIQLGFFGNLKVGKVQHVSGFSQSVSLGDIAKIEEDQTVAMRVRVTSKKPLKDQRFYWRGIAFDHYDGKSWTTSNLGTRFLYTDSENYFYNYNYWENEDTLMKQQFYLNPMDTRVIFGADRIVRISGAFVAVTRDSNGTLTGMSRPDHYEVYSRIIPVSQKRKSSASVNVPDNIRRYYLQLPFRSSRVDQLTRQITANASTTIDQVVAVKEYLQKNYQYTTTDLPEDDIDPVSKFLFERKAGHCEYFATSMVLLLRYVGIPARIVNGFLQGEYNDIGGFYEVRQSDAHSWVEVYVDGVWLPFDPSPRRLPGEGSPFFKWLNPRKLLDSVSFFWDRYILIFSAQDQLDALSSAREKYDEISKSVRTKSEVIPDQLQWLKQRWKKYRFHLTGIVILLAGITLAARAYLHRQSRLRVSQTPILFYREMLSILEKKGFGRPPATTPNEFIQNVSHDIPTAYVEDLSLITVLFYRSRFGKYPLTSVEQAHVRSSLQRLEQMR